MLLTLMAVAIAEEARQLAEHSRQRPHIMRADHLIRPLPRCSDEPLAAPITCGTEQQRFMDGHEVRHGASYRRMLPLCRGLMMIQSGTCAQLGNASFLREVVQTTGVTYDMRKQDLYGEAWKYMIRSSNGLRIGLWQDPSQFAAAMLYHGASRHEIANYVEVGCYTGWTGLVLVTYLQRVGHRTRGYLIDLTAQPMTLLLYTGLLKGRNLTFVERKEVPINKMDMVATYPELGGGRGSRNRAFDLCFIDAQHSYLGVLEDYSEFAPHCRNAMFHDIQCARRRRISASRPTSSDLAAPTPPHTRAWPHRARQGHVDVASRQLVGRRACLLGQPWRGGRAASAHLDHIPDLICAARLWHRHPPPQRQQLGRARRAAGRVAVVGADAPADARELERDADARVLRARQPTFKLGALVLDARRGKVPLAGRKRGGRRAAAAPGGVKLARALL